MQFKSLNLKLEKFQSFRHIQKKWLILIAVFIILLALTLTAVFLTNSILNSPYVYKGVLVDGVSVGGLGQHDVEALLKQRYEKLLSEMKITFFSDTYENEFSMEELGVSVNVSGMQRRAYDVGRLGSAPSRLIQISKLGKNPVNIPLEFHYDEQRLETILEDINRHCSVDLVVPKIVIQGDKAFLYSGVSGKAADKDDLRSKIKTSLTEFKSTYIHIPIKVIEPPKIDIETVYDAISQEPADAVIIKKEDGSADIKPHVNGRKIDKLELKRIIEKVETREYQVLEEIQLPVEVIPPKTKTEELKVLLFRDTLASYSTAFNTNTENNRNRGINIRLAAESVNGTVLFPGEEFSFNGVVGPRTREKGYQIAHIFSEGEIRDGYGGGICQVSTTLYDTVLLANLSVTERHNHIFTVGYVPLGLDAAVSFGYADLKFKNTTNYPIRINAKVSENNTLTFSISGTNQYPDVRVRLVPKVLKTTKRTTVYSDDPNLAAGTEIIEEQGMDGAIVDTYVQIYSGDDLVKEYKLHQSTYQMHPRKIRRGIIKTQY